MFQAHLHTYDLNYRLWSNNWYLTHHSKDVVLQSSNELLIKDAGIAAIEADAGEEERTATKIYS